MRCLTPLCCFALLAGCASAPVPPGPGPAARVPRMPCQRSPIPVAVGDFDAAGAPSGGVGQGMARLLSDSLLNSACFSVAEQEDASAGGVAHWLIQGRVVELKAPCKGGSLIVLPDNQACAAVEIRAIDRASGRALYATVADGDSAAARAPLDYARGDLPAGLAIYAGTPMERAIRNCVESAASSIAYWYLTEQP